MGFEMIVEAGIFGKRIALSSPSSLRGLREAVPGAYFSKTEKRWSVPLTMDHCRALRAHFGPSLRILPSLDQWARDQRRSEVELGTIGRSLKGCGFGVVPRRYPAMWKALSNRPYQLSGAFFLSQARSALNADSPGLGKTLTAIAGIVEAKQPGPYLVVAPQTSLDTVWEREIFSRVPDATVYTVGLDRLNRAQRTADLAEALDPAWDLSNTWVIINVEMMRTKGFWECAMCDERTKKTNNPRASEILCGHDPAKARNIYEHQYPALFTQEWGAIVMDECQRSLIRRTGSPTQTREGAMLLKARGDKEGKGMRIALSGTPMRGKPDRLFGTLQWLRPKTYTSYWSWAKMYFKVEGGTGFGGMTVGGLRPEREADLYKSLDGILLRRTKAEVSPDLPPKQYMGTPLNPTDPESQVAVWLDMSPEQARAYRQMVSTGSAAVEGGTVHALGLLAEMTRLKQFASSAGRMEEEEFRPALPSNKVDWLVQFLTERNIIDPDDKPTGKVVVVSQFTAMLRMAAKAIGVACVGVTGSVTGARRQAAIDTFNDPSSGVNVMFLNTTAGGVAITLDVADDMVFFDETHVVDDQEQTEDRINNRRPEERVATRRYWYLKSLGTIDEAIARVNAQQDVSQKALLDGRRGVAYLRAVMNEVRDLK
jgi:SNF2 family DNA or RNA helicase